MLIGIVGTRCSGKTAVARILEKEGFTVINLSDILRERARERGLPETREALFSIANELREKFGPAVLVDEVVNKHAEGDVIIDPLLNKIEIDRVRLQEKSFILGVDADADLRFARGRTRQAQTGKQEFAGSKEEFLGHDVKTDDPDRPPAKELLSYADVVVDTSGELADTEKFVLDVLARFRKSG